MQFIKTIDGLIINADQVACLTAGLVSGTWTLRGELTTSAALLGNKQVFTISTHTTQAGAGKARDILSSVLAKQQGVVNAGTVM